MLSTIAMRAVRHRHSVGKPEPSIRTRNDGPLGSCDSGGLSGCEATVSCICVYVDDSVVSFVGNGTCVVGPISA